MSGQNAFSLLRVFSVLSSSHLMRSAVIVNFASCSNTIRKAAASEHFSGALRASDIKS